MKAIRVNQFGGPEVLKLEEVADPAPAPGEVRIRVAAVGINPVETYIRAGTYPALPTLPFTPGNDGAGTIDALGEGVTNFAVGDRVYIAGSTTGTYAEKAIAKTDHIRPLPASVSFKEGAGVGVPYITAYRAIYEKALVMPGQSVLIHGGTGAVGLAAIQFLKHLGAIIIATGGTEEGRQLAKAQGASHVLDHRDDAHFDEIKRLTGGKGVDVVLEMLANKNLGKDLTVLARGGRVVVIGSRGEVTINPRDLMKVDGQILGLLGSFEHRDAAHAAIGEGLRGGWLKPIISKTFPLAEAGRAHEAVIGSSTNGKIVLSVP